MRHLMTATLAVLAAATATLSAGAVLGGAVKDNDGRVLVCYVGTWAYYRPGNGKFTPEDIDPDLCTHLVYAFVGITGQGDVSVLDSWLDLPPPNLDGYNRFLALKKKNPNLKVLVSIGGWNQGSYTFSTVANNAQLRKTFAQNVLNFVTEHGFDGFDMDWEYPALRGGESTDKAALPELLREVRSLLEPRGLLLTAAVSVGLDKIEAGYDVAQVSQHLDLINLMLYDLHGSWDSVTGMNAALTATKEEKYDPDNKNLNVESALRLWLDRGVDPSKVVLGVPFYGHTWTLRDPSNAGVYAAASGPGRAGPYTREAGTIGYNEVCVQQDAGLFKEKWDSKRQVPYAVEGNQWVSYDNVRSLKLKAQLAVDQGLAGVMGGDVCTVTNKFERDSNCKDFYFCFYPGQPLRIYQYTCGPGTLFNEELQTCDYADKVPCPYTVKNPVPKYRT
ncbi:Acidic mammalian chitinase, partial [Frankliniella fusca]